jgi:hypothetical protein
MTVNRTRIAHLRVLEDRGVLTQSERAELDAFWAHVERESLRILDRQLKRNG